MLVTLFPIITLERFEHQPKAPDPMLVIPLPKVTLVRFLQKIKAAISMLVTVLPERSRLTYLLGAPQSAVLMVGNSYTLLTFNAML
jgi:hypothetical protein